MRLPRKFKRQLVASLVLVALTLRALVPAGFMPAGNGPLSLVVCPDGLPAQFLLHHHHHDPGRSSHFDHCPFGGLGSAPAPHSMLEVGIARIEHDPPAVVEPGPVTVRLVRLPQPRGPPLPA